MPKQKKLTYQSAFDELNQIAALLESEEIDIDQVTKLVKRANELVKYCQERLRSVADELDQGMAEE